jgi:hypothetical protein
MNSNNSPAFWWVNQGSSYEEALNKGFIWAPKKNKSGRQLFYWENVSRVRSGDIIFHYADGNLRAISRAKNDGYDAKNELNNTEWSDDGWRVDTDYRVLSKPITIKEVGPNLAAFNLKKGPINKSGGVNQGYLYELTDRAVSLLFSKIEDDPILKNSGIDELKLRDMTVKFETKLSALYEPLNRDLGNAEIRVESSLIGRMVCSLLSKRFLILTGLAGSGKTKLAQAFAEWISPVSEDRNMPNSYHILIPVGADWTGNENILGYPNGLNDKTYVTTPALELILHARALENAAIPHFLILDEMNLSHVERYFADILSVIESGKEIPLYEGTFRQANKKDVPQKPHLPDNLFIVGTVNVDETTYMFSPKVLDRANVIEFRMEPHDLEAFLATPKAPKLENLTGKGARFGEAFVKAAADKDVEVPSEIKDKYKDEILLFFYLLREHNAEFGYRVAYEAARFFHFYKLLGGYPDGQTDWFNEAMDAVIVQKFLPKLHGSRSKLEGLLWALAWACGAERQPGEEENFKTQLREAGQAQDETKYSPDIVWAKLKSKNADNPAGAARYPLSFAKVMRMYHKLVRDQFVTFAEA